MGGSGGQAGAPLDILQQLQGIEGATIDEQPSDVAGYRFFLITFDQPVDHKNPAGQRFQQRIALHHRDSQAPTVLVSTGYTLWYPSQYLEEPTAMVSGNQLIVEHRYFTPSRPDPADWSKLTIEQAAADHHRIVQAFKTIYPGRWVSTGASKGGMTSVYHRRFYPTDVDGTIAYVAPHSAGLDDSRYIDFLATVGDVTCRTKLHDFEREVLNRRAFMLAQMADQASNLGLTYNYFSLDATLESLTMWFTWTFWQYYGASRCADIPTAAASDITVWNFFDEIAGTATSADDSTLLFEPYYWQADTQLGTPGLNAMHLQDLLTIDPSKLDDCPTIAAEPVFDPMAMQDVGNWLKTQGTGFLFIYGGDDPWSAGAFDLGAAKDSFRFYAAGKNHGAVIADLAPADRAKAEAAVSAWTGVSVGQPLKNTFGAPFDVRKRRQLRPR